MIDRKAFLSPSGVFQLFSFVLLFPIVLVGQETEGTIHAIVTPFQNHGHAKTGSATVRLARLQFVFLLYQDAVAVYTEADFKNIDSRRHTVELAVPSSGYRAAIGGEEVYNAAVLGLRTWAVEGQRLPVHTEEDEDAEWCTVTPEFAAGETKTIKSLYWLPTTVFETMDAIPPSDTESIVPGERHWLLHFSGATAWNSPCPRVDVLIHLADGLSRDSCALTFTPGLLQEVDSATYRFTAHDAKLSHLSDIHCSYRTGNIVPTEKFTLQSLSDDLEDDGYAWLRELAKTGH